MIFLFCQTQKNITKLNRNQIIKLAFKANKQNILIYLFTNIEKYTNKLN